MRASIAILSSGLLFGGAALADDKTPTPLTSQGNGALLFQLGGLFNSTPSSLDGVGVGGRYFLGEDMALRAAFGFSSSTNERKNGGNKTEDTSTDFALEGGLEMALMKRGPVYLYAGGIAQFLTGSSEPDGGAEESRTQFTVAGVVGGTYFFDEAMSVGAEYRLGIASESTETEPPGGGAKSESSQFRIGTGSVGFHLGFWF